MTNFDSDDLVDTVFEILAPNAMYMRSGNSDTSRYYFTPEALEALSAVALQIIIPILTSVSSSLISEWLKNRKTQPEKKIQIIVDNKQISDDTISMAERSLAEMLQEKGWPDDKSIDNAKIIVSQLVNILSKS